MSERPRLGTQTLSPIRRLAETASSTRRLEASKHLRVMREDQYVELAPPNTPKLQPLGSAVEQGREVMLQQAKILDIALLSSSSDK